MMLSNQKRKDIICIIDETELITGSTIFTDEDHITHEESFYLQNAIWVSQGNFSLCLKLNSVDSINLINLLNQHLENIKANEIELLALNIKAAA